VLLKTYRKFVSYRPYHLCHVEGMLAVAEAFLHRRATFALFDRAQKHSRSRPA